MRQNQMITTICDSCGLNLTQFSQLQLDFFFNK